MISKKKNLGLDLLLYLIISVTCIILAFKFVPNQFVVQNRNLPITRVNEDDKFVVLFFHKDGCPHCEAARPVIKKLQDKYTNVGWVLFNLSYSTPEMLSAYQSWLKAAGLEEAVTPLIVVGPKSGKPWITKGFLDEKSDRAPIENEIRRRLNLNEIDFSGTSFNIPFKGYTIMQEMSERFNALVFGFFSGFLPLTFFFLVGIAILFKWSLKKQVANLLMALVFTLAFRIATPTFSLHENISISIRLGWGVLVLGLSFWLFTRFFLYGEELFDSRKPPSLTMICTIFPAAISSDLLLTQWLDNTRNLIKVPMNATYVLAFFCPFFLAVALLGLIHFMKSRRMPRLKLLFLLFVVLFSYWGMLLVSGHGFTGFGEWKWL